MNFLPIRCFFIRRLMNIEDSFKKVYSKIIPDKILISHMMMNALHEFNDQFLIHAQQMYLSSSIYIDS